ncbi:hypothetical protein BJY28_000734 [Janibacter alkaliphilus]|uniref:Uncharacterized protein n=1 Tax=Janibacter alkaliphilus TaxID=1069963 RepID=A0A852XCS6_9MICO|nr:hypothetical protein [Janibacter alkaliphilus]
MGQKMWLWEEAVAVVRGLLGDLRAADRAVPDEGGDPVERARRAGEAVERAAVLALEADVGLVPQGAQQGVVLHGELDAVADVLAEPRVDRAGVAATQDEVDPAVGEVLGVGVVLGQAHRVVGRDERGRGGEDDPLGLRGQVGQQDRRVGGGGEGRVVVLAGGEDVQADLLGLLGDRHGGLDPLVLAGRPAGGGVGGQVADAEDAELHDRVLRAGG